MKEQVNVKVCVSTYSYVMGGIELIKLESELPEHLSGKVKVSGAVELSGIDEKKMKPPYASVNGRIISQADKGKVLRAIEKELNCKTA